MIAGRRQDDNNEENIPYRVRLLEEGIEGLASSHIELRDEFKDFSSSVKVWMKVLATIWGLIALIGVGILVELVVARVG